MAYSKQLGVLRPVCVVIAWQVSLSSHRGHRQRLLRCVVSVAVAGEAEVEAECSLLGRTAVDRGRSCHMLDERCFEADLRELSRETYIEKWKTLSIRKRVKSVDSAVS